MTASIRSAAWCLGVLAAALPASVRAGGGDGALTADPASYDQPSWSPDGASIAFTDDLGRGVHLLDSGTQQVLTVDNQLGSGYALRWSADGRRLGFKLFVPGVDPDFPLQVPAFYDLRTRQVVRLSTPVARAGVPSFCRDGSVAFSVEDWVVVLDTNLNPRASWPLGHYANLVALSPDGRALAYNDGDDAVWVLEIASGARRRMTTSGAWHSPHWSPDGRRLLLAGVSNETLVLDLADGGQYRLPRARSASWMPDGETILFASEPVPDSIAPTNSDLHTIRFDGANLETLTTSPDDRETAPAVAPDGAHVAWRSSASGLKVAPLVRRDSARGRGLALGASRGLLGDVRGWSKLARAFEGPALGARRFALTTAEISGVPFIHQVYDTPDTFNGHWACGPTAAMMTIAFRSILPAWDTTCSTPSRHVSSWGQYISNIYTFNGHTYDIPARTASGTGYGGYGYIRQNNSENTKEHMAEYLRFHGLESAVDWSPTWAELTAEIGKQQPFVLLSSITTSGHYKTVIGHYTAQHTVILNDPYGNKALGYMNYSGRRVLYDWPGYNNGHPSLVTVHVFVTSRKAAPVTGILKGVVFKAPDTNARLPGATVKLSDGKTATADATGTYQFTLPPGSYTATASATGYASGSATKTVVAGQTIWGSIGLFANAVTGNFKGSVYQYNATTPSDSSVKLPSAQVSLDGGAWQAVRAGDAVFNFAAAPGPHTVRARLTGYAENSSTRTVVGGADVWGSIGLSPTGSLSTPKVHLESPLDGANLESPHIEISGSLENASGVAEVRVKFGTENVGAAVVNGRFEVPIVVPVGDTRIEVTATNSAGTGSSAITIHFRTGVCGIVQKAVEGGDLSPLADASVEVLTVSDPCAAALKQTTTGADGRFCLDVPEGDYVIRTKAAGHQTDRQSLMITADVREQFEIPLAVGEDPPPSLRIESPQPGMDGKFYLNVPTVEIVGSVLGMVGSQVLLVGQEVPLEDDNTFKAVVALNPGENALEFVANGRCGETASATLSVVRGDLPGEDGSQAKLVGDDGCGCATSGSGLEALVLALGMLALRRTKRCGEPR